MKIAVLSGKGGTGKTTVAASIATSLEQCQYIDCDVEEPNGAIFLKPDIKESLPVKVPVPRVEELKCSGCGFCAQACQFNTLAVVKGKVLVFQEICHHCGACLIACPQGAITEMDREIGVVEYNEDGTFMQGKLNVGEPISVPIIRELKRRVKNDMPVIFDCPPGASCTVVHSIEGCDYCLLVTEPTPFGVHDLKIAEQLVRKVGIPFGVVLNKALQANGSVQEFCGRNDVEILMEIPFSQAIAAYYSQGLLPAEYNPEWKDRFRKLYEKAERGVQG